MSQAAGEALEAVRNRLNQVHLSLRKLGEQVNAASSRNVRLPPFAQLHQQFQVLITQLSSISHQLQSHQDLLRNTNVFPMPSFPTTQQEGLVTTLLRKKVLPEVSAWIDAGAQEQSQLLALDAEWCFTKVSELRDQFDFYGFTDNVSGLNPIPPTDASDPWTPNMVHMFLNQGQMA